MLRTLVISAGLATTAIAQPVEVVMTGEVEFNQINAGVLGGVANGESATITLMVDASVFVDGPNFPTRGYEINAFELAFDSGSIGLQDPYPATPYFILRDNDPAVDGFIISNNVEFPIGVQLDQLGIIEQFKNNSYVTYNGDTLSSLDIEDAYGTYDFTGLTVFNWTIDDGPFNAMGLIFEQLTISPAGCYADFNGDGSLDILDFVAFQNAFVQGDLAADCNGDGSLNILDFVCFQNVFSKGCA